MCARIAHIQNLNSPLGTCHKAGTLLRSFSIDYLISFAQLPICCWGGGVGERWEAKAPGIWIQQGCAAGKSPGQDLLQNQHSPSPSQLPVKPQICISFGSEFVMCQPDGCQGDMICSVTSSHVRMSYSEPDTPVHLVKAHCGVRGCGNK